MSTPEASGDGALEDLEPEVHEYVFVSRDDEGTIIVDGGYNSDDVLVNLLVRGLFMVISEDNDLEDDDNEEEEE